ncbi:MAG TPA: MFS transporter [Gammaproteobacteria bacterium]|nr:MFS transporter [Gammaproteobacteria bacterium]
MKDTSQEPQAGGEIGVFRSLKCRNYRRYYFGQLISLNGTWMHSVAQAWLVYRLTGSSFWLGLVTFCNLAPVLFLSLIGGIAADRFNRRKILILVQLLALLQALLLGILTIMGVVTPWQVAVLATLLGVLRAFEVPARHAFIAQTVPPELLSNAIGLSSSAFNVARFVGPSIAGGLVALWGEGPVFLINAFSFTAILLALLSIRVERRPAEDDRAPVGAHLLEGLRFATGNAQIRSALLMIGMVSLTSSAITVLMPVFAGEAHHGGARMMGVLMSTMGVGALLGALRLAARQSGEGLERVIGWAGLSLALCAIVFATAHTLWLALPLLAVAGYSHTSVAASANAMIQLHTADALRGRVMSIFSMIFIGLMPIGSLLGGAAAEYIGAPATVALFGLGFLLVALLFLRVNYQSSRSDFVGCEASESR